MLTRFGPIIGALLRLELMGSLQAYKENVFGVKITIKVILENKSKRYMRLKGCVVGEYIYNILSS